MEKAIIGKKLGMSQIFTPDGKQIPVTVVLAGPCPVVQIKTKEKEGYDAIQIGFGDIKAKKVKKPLKAHYKKVDVPPMRRLREFRLSDCSKYKTGEEITCGVFKEGDKVSVTGMTRGRGFTGVIQRWNAHRVGPMSHGTGPIHRSVGSTGACASPGRVFKNKIMPGHYGNEKVTVKNLDLVRVDEERNLLLIKGGIPGAKGGYVTVRA